MKKTIGITTDLADVFFIQALKEGYCNYMRQENQKSRDLEARLMMNKARLSDEVYDEKFDRLAQLLLMYDKALFPIFNRGFSLLEDMTEFAEICQVMPDSFYTDQQLDVEELSDVQAMLWKPILISAIRNIKFSDYYIEFAKEREGSPEKYISAMFDQFYNKRNVQPNLQMSMELSGAYSMMAEGYVLDYKCAESCALYTSNIIVNIMKTIMIYFEFNKNNAHDYYSTLFDNFSTTTNAVNDAYGIVRTQISNLLTLQPKFSTLHEVMSFKKKKKKEIQRLRGEISNLEEIIRTDGKEQAIQKAIADIRLANEVMIKGSASKKVAQIATYISVPVSLLELYTLGTPFSMIISAVGTIAQCKADIESKESDWLFVAR